MQAPPLPSRHLQPTPKPQATWKASRVPVLYWGACAPTESPLSGPGLPEQVPGCEQRAPLPAARPRGSPPKPAARKLLGKHLPVTPTGALGLLPGGLAPAASSGAPCACWTGLPGGQALDQGVAAAGPGPPPPTGKCPFHVQGGGSLSRRSPAPPSLQKTHTALCSWQWGCGSSTACPLRGLWTQRALDAHAGSPGHLAPQRAPPGSHGAGGTRAGGVPCLATRGPKACAHQPLLRPTICRLCLPVGAAGGPAGILRPPGRPLSEGGDLALCPLWLGGARTQRRESAGHLAPLRRAHLQG